MQLSSHTINLLLHFLGSGNMGKYSALWFCIVPPFGRANTATIELNIFPYCPPSHAIIYIYFFYLFMYIIRCRQADGYQCVPRSVPAARRREERLGAVYRLLPPPHPLPRPASDSHLHQSHQVVGGSAADDPPTSAL